MKRYLAFAGPNYYPSGGWEDFIGDFETLEDAVKEAKKDWDCYCWAHVVDIETKELVWNDSISYPVTQPAHPAE